MEKINDAKPSAAVITPGCDYGLGAAYIPVFNQAGWKARVLKNLEEYDGSDTLCIISFEEAGKHPGLIKQMPSASLAIDLIYDKKYESNYLDYPFYLLDNASVIIHDFETRLLLDDIIRPVNCRLVMCPYPVAQEGSLVDTGVKTVYVPKEFENHPWLKGINATPVTTPFPATVGAGSFIVIPEYAPCVWPLVHWGAATGIPVVAPGSPTFLRTIFYGALLFDPESREDFLLKKSMMERTGGGKLTGGKLRIGVVTPRVGINKAGGAEKYALGLAQNLKAAGHEAELITTCTDSMIDWNSNLPEGITQEEGIAVRRFQTDDADTAAFHKYSNRIYTGDNLTCADETQWMRNSIRSQAMEEYIRLSSDEYDCFLFIPYLYGTTFWGSQIAPEKSFLVPCYHDELYAYTGVIKQNAQWAAGLFFNTFAEKKLAESRLEIRNHAKLVIGVGVETDAIGDAARFREKYGIDGDFLLYAGRLQREKNLQALIDDFLSYAQTHTKSPALIFIGDGDFRIDDNPELGVRHMGFLPEQDKIDAFSACLAFITPSTLESFSIVMIEAWIQGRPVIANSRCEAAREHIMSCSGGLLYDGASGLAKSVDKICGDRRLADDMGRRGKKYALENFQWVKVISRLEDALRENDFIPPSKRLGDALTSGSEERPFDDRLDGFHRWLNGEPERLDKDPGSLISIIEQIENIYFGHLIREIENLERHTNITTQYQDSSHRLVIGPVWSRFRWSITRHIREHLIEKLENKQSGQNRDVAKLFKTISGEIMRMRDKTAPFLAELKKHLKELKKAK